MNMLADDAVSNRNSGYDPGMRAVIWRVNANDAVLAQPLDYFRFPGCGFPPVAGLFQSTLSSKRGRAHVKHRIRDQIAF